MALKDIYQQAQAWKQSQYDNAFNTFNAQNGGDYSSAVFDEYYGQPGGEIGASLEQQFGTEQERLLLSGGYIPIDANVQYGAKALGKSVPELLQQFYPGGTFEQGGPDDFSEAGTGQYFYKTAPGTQLSADTLRTQWPQVPGASRMDVMMDGIIPFAGMALGAYGLASGLGGALGSLGASSGSLSGLAAAPYEGFTGPLFENATAGNFGLGGGDMFFDDILGDLFDFGGDVGGDLGGGLGQSTGSFDWASGEWVPTPEPNMSFMDGGSLTNPGGNNWLTGTSASTGWGVGSSTSWLSDAVNQLKNLLPDADPQTLQKLLTSASSAAGGLFGDGGLLGTAASLAPSLAAINYARNLGSPDTSRLVSAYDSIDPNALALPYDIQTGKGREALTSSLTQRGITGSSFGNQDMASYDTLRQLGRQNLLTSGAGQRASIASQILAADQAAQKNKLDLYGRSLLALSGGLNPARSGAF